MSDQSDALNRAALERGLIEQPGPANAEPAGDPERPKFPLVQLPEGARSGIDFHREMGQILCGRGLYRSKDQVVTVRVDEMTGQAEIEAMDAHRFRAWVEQHLRCYVLKLTQDGAFKKPQMMGVDMAQTCLRADAFRDQLPRLKRVNYVRLPVRRANGHVELLPAGYDAESGIYTLPPAWDYDESMTAEEGFRVVEDLIREFAFLDGRSKATFYAALFAQFGYFLQPFDSRRVNFLFHANAERSGKTLLAEIILTVAWRWADIDSLPEDNGELRKRLDTAVRSASPYLVLDDLDRTFLRSGLLNSFMTASWWGGRKFHSQDSFQEPKTTVIFMTANNLEVTADIAGRTLICDLDSGEADSQAREIKRPIDAEFIRRPAVHKDLCSALWAMLRHWRDNRSAASPAPKRPLKGYESWSELFGGILLHLGLGDPFEQRKVAGSGNTKFDDMAELVEKLAEGVHEMKDWLFEDIVQVCYDLRCFPHIVERNGDWRKVKDGPDGGERLEFKLNGAGNSQLGQLFQEYGGRTFNLRDGRRVKFDHRGKNRHRRYEIAVLPRPS